MTVLKGDGRFQPPDNELNPFDSFNQDAQNDSDNLNGRVLRRQTGSSPHKETNDGNVASSVSSSKAPSTSRKRDGTVSPDSSNSNNTAEQEYDREGCGHNAKKSRKTVTFDGSTAAEANVAANSESDTSKRSRTAAQLAREQRSRRRQAALGVDGSEASMAVSLPRKPDNRVTHKKKVPGSSNGTSNAETDANVVRVPMLTGTLVLYRGSKPRAVFIRRV